MGFEIAGRMTVKLSETQLPQLLSWLEQHFPHSYSTHAVLESHLRGQFPDLEFFVDRWPHPQAVVARVDPEKEQWVSKGGKVQIVDGVFGLTEEAVSGLLRDPRVVDWKSPTLLPAMPSSVEGAVVAVTEGTGRCYTVCRATQLKATPRDLQPIPVPEGVRSRHVSSEEIQVVHSNWKLSAEVPEDFVRRNVEHHPSLYLVTDSGHHVGHMIGTIYGTMGLLYVNPEFRRKGYAKVIVSQLAQRYFDRGDDAYVHIEEENAISLNMHKALGFKADLDIFWIICE